MLVSLSPLDQGGSQSLTRALAKARSDARACACMTRNRRVVQERTLITSRSTRTLKWIRKRRQKRARSLLVLKQFALLNAGRGDFFVQTLLHSAAKLEAGSMLFHDRRCNGRCNGSGCCEIGSVFSLLLRTDG